MSELDRIRLRILVDRCSVEVFTNDGEAVIKEVFLLNFILLSAYICKLKNVEGIPLMNTNLKNENVGLKRRSFIKL